MSRNDTKSTEPALEHSEVVQLADTLCAICAEKPINVVGPALVLALYAAVIDTGAPPEHQSLVVEELTRRLLRMIDSGGEKRQ